MYRCISGNISVYISSSNRGICAIFHFLHCANGANKIPLDYYRLYIILIVTHGTSRTCNILETKFAALLLLAVRNKERPLRYYP